MPLTEYATNDQKVSQVVDAAHPLPVDQTSRPYDAQIGKFQRISPVGGMLVEQTDKLAGGGFIGAQDTRLFTFANTGTGSASSVSGAICLLTSGTSNSGYGAITTVAKSRFTYASANFYRSTLRLADPSRAGVTRSWGAFNFGVPPAIADGFYFSVNSQGVLSLNTISGGVVTQTVSSGSFNGEVSSYVVDINQHNWEIVYQVVGAWFYVDGVLLHHFSPKTQIPISTLQLGASAVCSNSASGVLSNTLEVWATSILRMGAISPVPQYEHINALGTYVLRLGPCTLRQIVLNTAPGNTNVITVYDSTTASGLVVAQIATGGNVVATLDYNLEMNNGLTILNATGASGDVTVVYD